MSAVKEGKGLATIEDITMACLGIFLERRDTSGGIIERRGKQKADLPKVFGKEDCKMFVSSGRTRGEGGRRGSRLCCNDGDG